MTVVPAQYYIETYTSADLDALMREFKIPETQHTELAKVLNDAAALWRWHDAAQKDIATPAGSTKALKDVSRHARKLSTALRDFPSQAYAALAAEATSATGQRLTLGGDSPKFLGVMVPEQDGSETPVTLDARDIGQLLDTLGQMATSASAFPPGRKGKSPNQALRIWISNIERFWTQTLGRPFTRDFEKSGAPVSEAARFCVAAIRNVSPDTPNHTVSTTMKKHIAAQRRKQLAK